MVIDDVVKLIDDEKIRALVDYQTLSEIVSLVTPEGTPLPPLSLLLFQSGFIKALPVPTLKLFCWGNLVSWESLIDSLSIPILDLG